MARGGGYFDSNLTAANTPGPASPFTRGGDSAPMIASQTEANKANQQMMGAGRMYNTVFSPFKQYFKGGGAGLRALIDQVSPLSDMSAALKSSGLDPSLISSAAGNRTKVNQGPIWGESQIQQRVNAMKAANAQQASQSQRRMSNRTASQGFAKNSPLAQQLAMNIDSQRMASDAAGENAVRWDTAQGNAEFGQRGQIAQGQLDNDYLRALLLGQQQAQAMLGYRNALAQQLLGVVGGAPGQAVQSGALLTNY